MLYWGTLKVYKKDSNNLIAIYKKNQSQAAKKDHKATLHNKKARWKKQNNAVYKKKC